MHSKKRFLWALLCSNDNFSPRYNRKMLIRKRTSVLENGGFNYKQLFHRLQFTACKMSQCSSTDKLLLSRVTGMLSTLYHFHCRWDTKWFGNGTRQNWTSLYQSWSFQVNFSYHNNLSILGKNFFWWNQSSPCLAIVANSTTVSLGFSR